MPYDQLKLQNQLCFPVYAASRLITREYQPLLDELGITYPQYLVLMLLWERDGQSVNEIAHKLILNTNTITPLLKRMEADGIIRRQRSGEDERKVLVRLTEEGRQLEDRAALIPERLSAALLNGPLEVSDLIELKKNLETVIELLKEK